MTFCVVSRVLARYQAEVDEESAREAALETAFRELIMNHLDHLPTALWNKISELVENDPDCIREVEATLDHRAEGWL